MSSQSCISGWITFVGIAFLAGERLKVNAPNRAANRLFPIRDCGLHLALSDVSSSAQVIDATKLWLHPAKNSPPFMPAFYRAKYNSSDNDY
jgi:hypothetical protein